MVPPRQRPQFIPGNASHRTRSSRRGDARLRLRFELLESRHLLEADLQSIDLFDSNESVQDTISPITWSETIQTAQRIPLRSLDAVDPSLPQGVHGPLPLAAGEWILQLKEVVSQRLAQLTDAEALLADNDNQFAVIAGLGDKGLILVRGVGYSKADIEASLAQNPNVASFSLNQLITGQATTPNDTDFVRGAIPSLTTIGAPSAWDVSRGNLNTVVGVLDTGIDLAHRDLYLNIWFNQGEIPSRFLDNVGNKLVDIDSDGLFTFYDLNHVTRAATSPYSLTFGGFANGPNAEFVNDLNGNGYIDGLDILADPLWADGRDTDGNGEVDDFFGVNFRGGGVRNRPMDQQGHGTHVAGTIGAIGGNGTGVTGINWSTSLMSLRILDDQNQGDTGSAIAAVNYARTMRDRYRINSVGRVTGGANVRVLNNSWGQPGGFESSLETAIQESGETGILFVAASGNGNFLGQGVDNDRTPFYPAGYDSQNVIAVASSNSNDSLASSSNFGAQSVDLAAPGTGIRSTELGGGYGTRNGTSMATPHVAGTAALVWSAFPEATVAEVRQAIESTVDPIPALAGRVKTGGRLNLGAAMSANVFAPAARLISKQDITRVNGTSATIRVEYSHRSGMALASINGDDLSVTRQWGPAENVPIRLSGKVVNPSGTVTATYIVTAPGGTWDALDFGDYLITTQAGKVTATDGSPIQQRDIGKFNVRISNNPLVPNSDPTVLYASTFTDQLGTGSLRTAIIAANAAGAPRTILLDSGIYSIGIPSVPDPSSTFPQPPPDSRASTAVTVWSNGTTGDFDITGSVTIIGNQNDFTVIDGKSLDRVFKVHPGARLELQRVTVTGGQSPPDQGGGGILSAGELTLREAIVRGNNALGDSPKVPIGGGGIAAWAGAVAISQSWIDKNEGDVGGGVFLSGDVVGTISQSTFSDNGGGGLYSVSSNNSFISNSTLSANVGGKGALANGNVLDGGSARPSLSADGRFIAFESSANNLVLGDTNDATDIFVYDTASGSVERVSLATDGTQADNDSRQPSISANGRFVTFRSNASNLVPGSVGGTLNVFVYDRDTGRIEQVNLSNNGTPGISGVTNPDAPRISADGRFVAFDSQANNLVPEDTNGNNDVFVYDRDNDTIELVSKSSNGLLGNSGGSGASISADGRFVAFHSNSFSLIAGQDATTTFNVFVYDRSTQTVQQISVDDTSTDAEGNQLSSGSFYPSLSADGRFVAFTSDANNLVPGDTNSLSNDLFVYDRLTSTTELISVAADAAFAYGGGTRPAISGDGRFVAFEASATDLVSGITNRNTVFVKDRITNSFTRISDAQNGSLANATSHFPSISADGRFAAFESRANNLISGDKNGKSDIFVYDRDQLKISSAPPFQDSMIHASQLTIADTIGSLYAVAGNVELKDSLLVNSIVEIQNSVLTENVIDNRSGGASKIASLKRQGFFPPVRPLLRGNPAIDAGGAVYVGTQDQLGTERGIPDIGAVEATAATVSGTIYVDFDNDQVRDTNEDAFIDASVSLRSATSNRVAVTDSNGSYSFEGVNSGSVLIDLTLPSKFKLSVPELVRIPRSVQPNAEATTIIPETATVSSDGRFVAFTSSSSNLVAGDTNGVSDVFVYDRRNSTIQRVSVAADGTQANGRVFGFFTSAPSVSISADGRYVAFASAASNLVPGDTNANADVFVYDRQTSLIERVSIATDGTQADGTSYEAKISADGRSVMFLSNAGNLVPGDTNFQPDVFVYDRNSKSVARINIATNGIQDSTSFQNSNLSGNGRFVAFESFSNNFVQGDTNSRLEIFVYDRDSNEFDRVSLAADGTQANDDSRRPSISADGRYVIFSSGATNLVPGDTNNRPDLFIFDRLNRSIERVISSNGEQSDGYFLTEPSISADGRYVTFTSSSTNLVPNDTNGVSDVFLYDREDGLIRRVSVAASGAQSDKESRMASISADGRFITFLSAGNRFVAQDTNRSEDVFMVSNPLFQPQQTIELYAGDLITDLDFGLLPDAGEISGRLFDDSTIVNGVFDIGEKLLTGLTVFVDANRNGLLDQSERSAISNASGVFRITGVPGFRNHVVRTVSTASMEQVVPRSGNDTAFNIFLPAGGVLTELDFGFRPITTTGQSSDSIIRGRVMTDANGSGFIDAGDTPASGRVVYLDGGTLGVRDFNDPQTVTDVNGNYSFTGLPSTLTPVRLLLDDSLLQVTPLGNDLLGNSSQPLKYPLGEKEQRGGNPQSIVTGDYNGDGFADVAVVLGETNKLSIRLNDELGGFTSQKLDFNLSDFAIELNPANRFSAPIALVADQLDANPQPDFVIAGNFTGNVLVLLNFDSATGTFGSKALLPVGQEPIDIVSGQFGGDSALDLAVLNRFGGTLRVLTNNGAGIFTVGAPVVTGGISPVSLAVGNFIGSGALDIAVTHSVPRTTTTTDGGVTVLIGDGIGGFAYNGNYYPVQATPLDSAVGDFNKDGRPDLAVVNFSSNSISILLGQADGTLRVQSTTLGTVNGAVNLGVADLNNDGLLDVVTTKLAQRQVSIFRNSGVNTTTGEVRFEPQENIGLGEFQFGEQMPFAMANLDNDTTGPNGAGTLDIVAIPRNTDTLYVLPNRLVQGSRRVSVSGASTDIASGIDFLVAPIPVVYSIESTAAVKAEGNSLSPSTPFTFTVSRSGVTTGVTTINYTVSGDALNGASGSDFVGGVLPSGTVTFAAGVTSQVITIHLLGDSFVEADEGFVVTLNTPSGSGTISTATANGLILNDDTSYAIAATSANRSEGNSLVTPTHFTFTVTRSGVLTGIGTVNYAVTGGATNSAVASDFLGNAFPQGTVVFADGVTSQVVVVSVIGDLSVELDESFIVTLSAPSLPATITSATAIGTIRNDDTSFAIAASSALKSEGQSLSVAATFAFTVTRRGATTATHTVNYVVAGSGANPVSASDFVGNVLPSGTLSFAPGVTSQQITLNVIGDSIVELNEDFVVSLLTPSATATITTPTAIGTILNDDTAFVITATSAVKREGQSPTLATPYTFTVTRSGLTTISSTVNFAVTGSAVNPAVAADFVGNALPSGTLTFAAGVTSRLITINVIGDSLVELDEGFIVTLNTPSLPATITTASAMGMIQNDDTTFTIAATAARKPEGQSLTSATPFTFTVTRSGATTGQSMVSYTVTGIGSGPASAADFVDNVLPSGTVTFAAGQTTKLITVNVAGDSVVEANEQFAVTLNTPSSPATITTASAVATIENDDIGLAIRSNSASKAEGQSLTTPTAYTFTVTRTGLRTGFSTVNYVVTGSGPNPAVDSDFLGNAMPSGTVVFGPGSSSQVIVINVVGDSIVETNESFTVNLTSPNAPAVIITASASGTILNDDTSFAIAATSAVKAEGNGGGVVGFTFTVTRSGLTTGTGSVRYAVSGDTSNAASASDFEGNVLPSGTVAFAAGETSKVITINVLSDSLQELTEGFIVTLSSPVSGTIAIATAVGSIQNDD